MAIISGGQGSGEISIYLRDYGVGRDDWSRLEKTIGRFTNVLTATVSPEGWLRVTTNLPGFKVGEDLAAALNQVQERIIHACTAKVRV